MATSKSGSDIERAGSRTSSAGGHGHATSGRPETHATRARHDDARHTGTADSFSDRRRRAREELASPPTALLGRMCQLATNMMGCTCSHTVLLQPEQHSCVVVAAHGETSQTESWESFPGLAVPSAEIAELLDRLGQDTILQGPTATLPRGVIPFSPRSGVTWNLYIPLRWNRELVGYQHAGYVGRTTPLPGHHEREARALAELSGASLATFRVLATLEDANAFKGRFLGNLAHELRAEMYAILGYGDLLVTGEYGPLTPESSEIVERMLTSSTSLLDLFTATLDLSCLEQRAIPLDVESMSLGDLIAVLEMETRMLAKPGVDVVWQVPSNLPTVRTDPVKLKIMLRNLVANALKFTEQGTVTIRAQPQRGGVTFTIADTGPGITAAAQAVMFEPFSQGARTGVERNGGVGLGLFLARRIVGRLGGTLTVESEIGHGACFRVWLPRNVGMNT
jgi:signal transduction histidine kinase